MYVPHCEGYFVRARGCETFLAPWNFLELSGASSGDGRCTRGSERYVFVCWRS